MMSTAIIPKHCRKCGGRMSKSPKNKWPKGRCENPVCRKTRRKDRDLKAPFRCQDHPTYHGLQSTRRDCGVCQALYLQVNAG